MRATSLLRLACVVLWGALCANPIDAADATRCFLVSRSTFAVVKLPVSTEALDQLRGFQSREARKGSDRGGDYLTLGGRLDRIEGSGLEVMNIAALFREKGLDARTHLRLEATEENAIGEDVEKAGFIHFSAHGVLTERVQAIALTQIPGDAGDGFLTLGEIMNCRYAARLVVLSACETAGLGKAERAEGVIGLTRAVMYAGSPAAVVSLWGAFVIYGD